MTTAPLPALDRWVASPVVYASYRDAKAAFVAWRAGNPDPDPLWAVLDRWAALAYAPQRETGPRAAYRAWRALHPDQPVLPGPGSTGPHGDLEPSSLTELAPGSYDNLEFAGSLRIPKGEVTLTNCRVPGFIRGLTGTTVHLVDVETHAVYGDNQFAERIELHGSNDLWAATGRSELLDSWLHDPVRREGLHPDCAQFNKGGPHLIRCSVLNAVTTATGDLCNSAVQITDDLGPGTSVLIDDCWLSGGNYTLNAKTNTQVEVRATRFDKPYRYGPIIGPANLIVAADCTDGSQPARVHRW